MTSKEYLRRYKELTKKEELTEMEIETIERRLLLATATWKDILIKEKEEAEANLKEIRTALKEIIKTTKKIQNDFLKDLIKYRYFDFLPWEEVTETLNAKYKPRSLNNIKQYSHNRALEELQSIIDNSEMLQ